MLIKWHNELIFEIKLLNRQFIKTDIFINKY